MIALPSIPHCSHCCLCFCPHCCVSSQSHCCLTLVLFALLSLLAQRDCVSPFCLSRTHSREAQLLPPLPQTSHTEISGRIYICPELINFRTFPHEVDQARTGIYPPTDLCVRSEPESAESYIVVRVQRAGCKSAGEL